MTFGNGGLSFWQKRSFPKTLTSQLIRPSFPRIRRQEGPKKAWERKWPCVDGGKRYENANKGADLFIRFPDTKRISVAGPNSTKQKLSCKWSYRPVYTGGFLYNFCRAQARGKNRKYKLAVISVRFFATISQRFRTCSKVEATWRQISHSNRKEIAMKSPLVYTCDESCIGERDKNRIKNHMCKRALRALLPKNRTGVND